MTLNPTESEVGDLDGNGAGDSGRAINVKTCVRTYTTPGGAAILALQGVSLDLAAGSITALCGPSGSGKSTLLHLIGGMDRPDSGSILVDGQDITTLAARDLVKYRRTVGFVFQAFALLPALTAQDNVMLPVIPQGRTSDHAARAAALLAEVGLAGRENALPHQLSGGQRQRVAVARALMGKPRLIVADEPTGNLDSATGEEIVNLLFNLRDTRGITIIIGTHDEALAARCDTTVRLGDGQVQDAHTDARRAQT